MVDSATHILINNKSGTSSVGKNKDDKIHEKDKFDDILIKNLKKLNTESSVNRLENVNEVLSSDDRK